MEENGLESLQEVRQALQLTDKQLMQDKIEVPAYRMLYLDEALQENAMMEVIRDVSFASRIEKLQNPDFEKEYVPDSLKGILREYQKTGAAWIGMLYSNRFGGILADDMGLGKTLQVISFLLVEHTGCSLIVCPASLVYNWKHELERFAPSLKAFTLTVSFLVSSPFPKILTPSFASLITPASIRVAMVTSVSLSNLSNALTFTASISLEFLLVKPLFGIRLYSGICPPSNPTLGAPERAF